MRKPRVLAATGAARPRPNWWRTGITGVLPGFASFWNLQKAG